MRQIKLTGRETTVIRALGFSEAIGGAELQESTRMQPEDVTDTLNGLMSAGFVESTPFYEQVELSAMPGTMFEVNPSYAHEIKIACFRGY